MVGETAVRSTVERAYGGAGASAARRARMIGCARRKAGVQRGKGPGHEGSGAGGGDRRRHRRLQRALPSGEARLVRRDAGREDRAHRRLHLARRRAAAALQHELQRRPAAQVLDRPLPAAGGGNRAGRELPPHRQPQARHQPGADGRVPQLLRHGEHHRRPLRADRPQRDRRPLAALQPGGAGRRPLPPPRRPCRTGGRDPGAGEGRARSGGRRSTATPRSPASSGPVRASGW